MPNSIDFAEMVKLAADRYAALTPEQKADHDYAQRRSFVRGMCPSDRDFGEWCKTVDRLMPP